MSQGPRNCEVYFVKIPGCEGFKSRNVFNTGVPGMSIGVLLGARARANCPTWHEVPASHWSLVSRDLDTGLWLVGSPEPGRDFLRLCLTRNRAMFGWKQGRKQAFWANNKAIQEIFGTMFRIEVKKFGKTYFSLHLHFFAKYFGVDGSGAGARGWAGERWSRIPLPTSSPWSQNWRDGWIMFPLLRVSETHVR